MRFLPESGYKQFEQWLSEETWDLVTSVETAHEQALALQSMSIEAINIFPTSDDQP